MHGIVDEKTDVFSYGVLLLELITGRRPVDSDKQNLVLWVSFAGLRCHQSPCLQSRFGIIMNLPCDLVPDSLMLQDQSARFVNAPGKLPMMGNYFVYYMDNKIADEAALEGRNKNSNSQGQIHQN